MKLRLPARFTGAAHQARSSSNAEACVSRRRETLESPPNSGYDHGMHKIIQSYLREFVTEAALDDLQESEQFERFVNHCVVTQSFPDNFDVDSVTTSDEDFGIDGVAVVLGDELVTTAEDARSLLLAAKPRRSLAAQYIFVQAKRSDNFDSGEMLKLGSGVAALFGDAPDVRDDVLAEFLEIHNLVVENLSKIENGRPNCALFYVTTGIWNAKSGLAEKVLDPTQEQLMRLGLFHHVSFEPVDREHLINLWVKTRAPVAATFSVKGTVALPPIKGVTEAYLALAPAKEFIDNVLSDSEGRIRTSVFEQNVRAFLGDDNPVNASIREALADPALHDRFAINNNGITIVSPDVRVQSDRVSVNEYQIVNGCQTSHVLYRNRSAVDDSVWIPVKVIEAEDPDVVGQLVEATNSQTTVAESQFLSIRPSTRKIEAYFNAFAGEADADRRLYFERRTNQYVGQGIGKVRVFDIPKLARCFAAMFLDLPHIAYMYPTQALKERASDLFRADHHEHMYYTAALASYRLELAIGNKYVARKYKGYFWHMLMILKYLTAGVDMPRLESPKIEGYCAKIDTVLAKGGKASAPPFEAAAKIIDQVGTVTRDRRKGQRYTEELKSTAIKASKKTRKK